MYWGSKDGKDTFYMLNLKRYEVKEPTKYDTKFIGAWSTSENKDYKVIYLADSTTLYEFDTDTGLI